jgi:hypothetical protein
MSSRVNTNPGRASSVFKMSNSSAVSETGLSWKATLRPSESIVSPPWFMAFGAAGAAVVRARRRIAFSATSSRGLNGLVT